MNYSVEFHNVKVLSYYSRYIRLAKLSKLGQDNFIHPICMYLNLQGAGIPYLRSHI